MNIDIDIDIGIGHCRRAWVIMQVMIDEGENGVILYVACDNVRRQPAAPAAEEHPPVYSEF